MRKVLLFASLSCGILSAVDASSPFDVRFKRLTDDVYVAYRPNPVRVPVEGNVTIIVNPKDVIVVDGSGAPSAARQVIAEIRRLTPNPVRYLVNTHGHGDHTAGNQEYVKAFPHLEIVSHPGTRNYMVSGGLNYIGEIAENVESRQKQGEVVIERIRNEAKSGWEQVIAHLQRYYGTDILVRSREYSTVEITPPTMMVDDRLILQRGPRQIQILFLGYGKTASDLIVYLPREKIIVTGDIVTHPIPYGFSRKPSSWVSTLEKLEGMDFELLVPGHGDVQNGKAYLHLLIRLVQSVSAQVRRAVSDGLDLEATRERIDLSEFEKEFTTEDPVLGYRFGTWFRDPLVQRFFDEPRGEER